MGKKLNNPQAHPNQSRAPIYEALEAFRQMRVVPFDVPGHKRGRGNPELTAFLGQQCVGVDVNSMKPLDNLCHPVSVIREAEELAADAFGADGLLLLPGCADLFNPKTVRASMGALFRLPVWRCTLAELRTLGERSGLPLLGSALGADAADVRRAGLERAVTLIGSEGRGLSGGALAICGGTVRIPMRERCESLNAAAAAAVLLWEGFR